MNSIEDAVLYTVSLLRDRKASADAAQYGYDVYMPAVVRHYVRSRQLDPEREAGHKLKIQLSALFFDAAWELARRGIIRPGVRTMELQSTADGSAGAGFSITPFGRKWLAEDTQDIWVSTEPDRFAQMISPFRTRFGDGFHARAQEAVRCYGAHAYLACCTMCGAAAESILLATAIGKVKDEQKVLVAYSGSQGRSRVENMVVGKAPDALRREFLGLTGLLKYWRDTAAHGHASTISENEAYTALALLLRYASVVNERWNELTA